MLNKNPSVELISKFNTWSFWRDYAPTGVESFSCKNQFDVFIAA